MASSDGNGAFASAVPGKRFHFIIAAGSNGQLTQSGIGCRQHGAQQGQLKKSQRHEYGCEN
jgi:hypothetical protein